MKKVIEKLNRVLAILLVAAMVVGSVPEMGLVARAEGTTDDGATSDDDATTGEITATGDVGSDGTTLGEAEAQGLDTPDADPADQATPSGEQSEPDDKTEATVSSGASETPAPTTPTTPTKWNATITYNKNQVTLSNIVNIDHGEAVDGTAITFTVVPKNGYKLKDTRPVYAMVGSAEKTVSIVEATGACTLAAGDVKGNVEIIIQSEAIGLEFANTVFTSCEADAGITGITTGASGSKMTVDGDLTFTADAGSGKLISTVTVVYVGDSEVDLEPTLTAGGVNEKTATYTISGSKLAENVTGINKDKKIKITVTGKDKPENTSITLTSIKSAKYTDASGVEQTVENPTTVAMYMKPGVAGTIKVAAKDGYVLPATSGNIIKGTTENGYTTYTITANAASATIAATLMQHTIAADPSSDSGLSINVVNADDNETGSTIGSSTEWGKNFEFVVDLVNGNKLDGEVTAKIDGVLYTLKTGKTSDSTPKTKYIISAADLKGTAAKAIKIYAKSYKYKPVIKYSKDDFTSVEYSTDGSTYSAAEPGKTIIVKQGENIDFKATRVAGRNEGAYMNGGSGTASGNVYTWSQEAAANIKDEYVFELKASTTLYTTTAAGTINTDATLTYTDDCVIETNKIRPNTDLTFKVTPGTDKAIDEVTYTIDDVEKVIRPVNGVYTIQKADIKGDVTIAVTQVSTTGTNFTITFEVENIDGDTAETDTEAQNKTTNAKMTSVDVAKGGTAEFKVKVGTGKKLLYVSTSQKDDPAAIIPVGENNVYSLSNVTYSRKVYIVTGAEKMTLTQRPARDKKSGDAAASTIANANYKWNTTTTGETAETGFESNAAQITRNQDVTLTITPTAPYKVVEVKYGKTKTNDATENGERATQWKTAVAEGGKFILKNVNANTSFVAYTELDPNATTGLYKISWTADEGVASVDVGSDTDAKSPYLTTSMSGQTVKIQIKSGYKIVSVKRGETAVTLGGDATAGWTLTSNQSADRKDDALTITTELEAAGSVRTFTIENTGSRVTYSVPGDENVVANGGGSYTLRRTATSFTFTVTAAEGVEPVVKKTGESEPITGTKGEGNVYTYMIPATKINTDGNDKITISEKSRASYFTIKADDSTAFSKVEYWINGTMRTVTSTPVRVVAEAGDTVAIKAYAKDNCGIKEVKMIPAAANYAGENDVYTFTAEAGDADILIKTEKETSIVIKEKSGTWGATTTVSKETDGSYLLEAGQAYEAKLITGDPAAVTAANGGETITAADVTLTGGTTTHTVDGTNYIVNFTPSALDGINDKALTLTVKKGEDTYTATIKIAKVAVSVKIDGKTNPSFVIDAGTTKTYPIKVEPEGASLVKEWVSSGGFAADVSDDGKTLTITAPANASATGTIKLYDKGMYSGTGDGTPLTGGTIAVAAREIAEVKNAKPSVKLTTATGQELCIAIKGPKTLPEQATGKGSYWYQIHYKYTGDDTSFSPTTASPQYKAYTGETTNVVVNVSNGTAAERPYDVSVKLVQSDKTDAPGTNSAVIITSSSMSAKVAMKTRAEYYDSKLTLKTVNGTVYTGQKDVVLAVPVYGAKTSRLEITGVEDITTTASVEKFDKTDLEATHIGGAGGLTDGIKIAESVKIKTVDAGKAGRHTIRVTAKAGTANAQPIYATVTVNVVKGVEGISLYAPGDGSVYKKPGKAATVQTTVTYNGGDSRNKPSKAKVTYEILDAAGAAVTAKNAPVKVAANGKVTISADTEPGTKFSVRATAADYTGGSIYPATRVARIDFTVTSDVLETGAALIVDAGGNVLSRETGEDVEADALDGAKIVVLKKGADDGNTKTKYDLTKDVEDAEGFVYKTSNAGAMTVGRDGTVTVKKPARGVKITVTDGAGSGMKEEIKNLTITSPGTTAGRIGLRIHGAEVLDKEQIDEYVYSDSTKKEATYTSNGSTYIYLELATRKGGTNSVVSDKAANPAVNRDAWYNYQITATDAADVTKFNGQKYIIMPKKQNVKITFKNKDTGETFDYTVKNTVAPSTAAAPAVAVDGILTAGASTGNHDVSKWNRVVTITAKKAVEYTKAYVMLDRADYDRNDANKARYGRLEAQIAQDLREGSLHAVNNSMLRLNFGDGQIDAGTYKVTIIYGDMSADGKTFEAKCKAVTANIKAAAPVKATYTPARTYKMSTLDAPMAVLTGRASAGVKEVRYTKILNKNSNGKANDFTGAFQLDNGVLGIKNVAKAQGENLTGYAEYVVTDVTGYEYPAATVEIKVTLVTDKKAGKFTARNVTILQGAAGADLAIMQDGREINLTANSVKVVDAKNVIKGTLQEDNKTIRLTDLDGLNKGTYTIKVLFVPQGGSINPYSDSEKPSVTVKVTVQDKKAAGRKISLASDSIDMTGATYVESTGDGNSGYYTKELAYTQTVEGSALTLESDTDGVKFEKGTPGKLKVKLYRTAVEKAKAGTVQTVKITAGFGEGTTPENLTLKVKYPEYVASFEDVVAETKKLKDSVVIYSDSKDVDTLKTNAKTAIESMLTFDSRSEVGVVAAGDTKTTVAATDATTDGVAYMKVTLTDNTKAVGTDGRTEEVFFNVIIKGVANVGGYTRKDYIAQRVAAYTQTVFTGSNTLNNSTTLDMVKKDLEKYLGLRASETLYLVDAKIAAATDKDSGSIEFNVKVFDVVGNAYLCSTSTKITMAIPQLQTIDQVKTAIETGTSNAWNHATNGIKTTGIVANKASVEAAINEYLGRIITNKDIEATIIPKGKTAATGETDKYFDGSKACFVIELTNPKSAILAGDKVTVYKDNASTDPMEITVAAVTAVTPETLKKEVMDAVSATAVADAIYVCADGTAAAAKIQEVVDGLFLHRGYKATASVTEFQRALYDGQHVSDRTDLGGKCTYTVAITKADGTAVTDVTATITTLKNAKYQTAADLAKDIEWKFEQDATATDIKALPSTNTEVQNKTAIAGYAAALVKNSTDLKVEYAQKFSDGLSGTLKDICDFKQATITETGSLKAKFAVKNKTTDAVLKYVEVNVSLTAQTPVIGATKNVKAALEKKIKEEIQLTNEDNTAEGLEAKQAAIKALVETVLTTDKFTVTVTVPLTIDEATKTAKGEGIITLHVENKTPNSYNEDITLTAGDGNCIPIPELVLTDQTFSDAVDKAKKAGERTPIENTTEDNAAGIESIEEDIQGNMEANINTDKFTVELAKQWEAGGVTYTEPTVNEPGEITFTATITDKATKKEETIEGKITVDVKDQILKHTGSVTGDGCVDDVVTTEAIQAAAALVTTERTEATIKAKVEEELYKVVKKTKFEVTATPTAVAGQEGKFTVEVVVQEIGKTPGADTKLTVPSVSCPE